MSRRDNMPTFGELLVLGAVLTLKALDELVAFGEAACGERPRRWLDRGRR